MVGLGARRFGHRSGMPSAAAEVMESFAEFSSFLAAFKVENNFWIVAVRNGIILQDALFETESAARNEYLRLSGMPDWGSVFAPGSWSMPRAVEKRVEDVVTGNVKATLHTISRFKANFLALLLLGALVLGLGYLFHEPIVKVFAPKPQVSEIDPVLAEKYKRQIEEKNKELDQKYGPRGDVSAPEPVLMPYDLLPDPQARARICYAATGFLMQPIPGWVQTSIECNETHAIAVFQRGFGNLADFYEVASGLMPGVFVEEKSESEIRVTAKLPGLVTYSSLEEKDPDTIAREVNTAFQRLDMTVDTNIAVDPVNDVNGVRNLNVVEVGAKSKLIPMEFMKIFGDLYGVYMTLAAWDVKSRTWNYEVIIYAK